MSLGWLLCADVARAEPPVCDEPAPQSIRTDTANRLWFSVSCTDTTDLLVDAPPQHGTLEAVPGSWSQWHYQPDPGYSGPDAVTFHAEGPDGASPPFTVAIAVDPTANRPPVCGGPVELIVRAGRPKTGGAACYDDDHDPLTRSVETAPEHGAVELGEHGTYVYTPDDGYLGADALAIRVSDAFGGSDVLQVAVTVTDQNQAPLCQTTASVAREGRTDRLGALNCSDPDDDALSYSVATQPAHGVVSPAPGGGWQIAVPRGYTGSDTVVMSASDGVASTEVTVLLTIVGSGDTLPECEDHRFSTPAGRPLVMWLGCFDRDLDTSVTAVVAPPAAGTGRLEPVAGDPQSLRFVPADGFVGVTSFTYRGMDEAFPDEGSAPRTVTIDVQAPAVAVATVDGPPRLSVAKPRAQRLGTATSAGVAVTLAVDEACTLDVRVTLPAAAARRAGLGRKALVIGRARRAVQPGRTRLRVKLARKARRALRRSGRRTTLRVSAVATDAAGQRRALTSRVVIRP